MTSMYGIRFLLTYTEKKPPPLDKIGPKMGVFRVYMRSSTSHDEPPLRNFVLWNIGLLFIVVCICAFVNSYLYIVILVVCFVIIILQLIGARTF